MILGQRIKEEREKRQWTQDYLAETLNVSRQAISRERKISCVNA